MTGPTDEQIKAALRAVDSWAHRPDEWHYIDEGFKQANYLAAAYRRLSGEVERLAKERDSWMETAAQLSRDADFYRGLVTGIGAQFGEIAYISDDGSKQQDVLCLKVPELVAATLKELAATKAKAEAMERVVELARGLLENYSPAGLVASLGSGFVIGLGKALAALDSLGEKA